MNLSSLKEAITWAGRGQEWKKMFLMLLHPETPGSGSWLCACLWNSSWKQNIPAEGSPGKCALTGQGPEVCACMCVHWVCLPVPPAATALAPALPSPCPDRLPKPCTR